MWDKDWYRKYYKGSIRKRKVRRQKAYNAKNRAKVNESARKYYHNNPEKVLNTRLKMTYGITIDMYNKLLKRQKGLCVICRKKCSHYKRLSVDHDHKTKKVRGLLCNKCNRSIGFFCEDWRLLKRAYLYLRRNS